MISYSALAVLLCTTCLCLAGCAKDEETADDGAAGAGGNNCEAIASENDRLSNELGCTRDTKLASGCAMLYARNLCTAEWEALTGCLDFVAADFICDPERDNRLEPISCTAQKAAFDACVDN
jgi:hypothetical protein